MTPVPTTFRVRARTIWPRLIVTLGLTSLGGCIQIGRAVDNVCYEHALRSNLRERAAANRELAKKAWAEACPESPPPGFGEGFVDGYTDYLDMGGSGGVPVPPADFRFDAALGPDGQLAVAGYYDGFSEGTRAARASGWRERLLVPLVLPPSGSPGPATLGTAGARPPTLPEPTETIPPPKGIGPAEDSGNKPPPQFPQPMGPPPEPGKKSPPEKPASTPVIPDGSQFGTDR